MLKKGHLLPHVLNTDVKLKCWIFTPNVIFISLSPALYQCVIEFSVTVCTFLKMVHFN